MHIIIWNNTEETKHFKNKINKEKNRHPFTLNDSKTKQVKKLLDEQKFSPKCFEFKNYIKKEFDKELNYHGFVTLLTKLGYKLMRANLLHFLVNLMHYIMK